MPGTHPLHRAGYESKVEQLREAIEDEIPWDYVHYVGRTRTGISTPEVVATFLDRLPNELHKQASDLLDQWAEIRYHELEPGEDDW